MSRKLRGKVEKRDLEGGIYQLVSDDGSRTTLVGARDELKAAVGKAVEVEGEGDEGFGIAMTGAQFKVSRVRKL
jgi:hypothetical protein